MSIHLLWLSLVAVSPVFASNAPIPYKWGEYKASELAHGKVIIVDWFSPEGKKRLERSRYKTDFYQMAHAYQPQINPVYATIASAVVVLNAMRLPKHTIPSQDSQEIPRPPALNGGVIPFPAYSQLSFLNADTDKVKDRKLILLQNANRENENDKSAFKPGLGMPDLKKILESVYHAKVDLTSADAAPGVGSKRFRQVAKKVLADSDTFLIANFKGDLLGASTEGTTSPIAAYDEKTDSLLVLDVTGHKNPWYWVPLEPFYRSMNTTFDGIYRGYVEVSE